MKLSRFSKKVIAVVCAVAMVVAGLTFMPDNTKADDYSGLTFTDITNNNNTEFNQNLKGSQKAINTGSTFSTLNVCQYQNAGFRELYIAGPWSAANLQATVNGVANSVTVEGAGLRIYNAADYLTKRYNVIKVTTSDGTDGEIIVFCPEIPEEETTTVDPSAPTTTEGPTTTAEPTTTEGQVVKFGTVLNKRAANATTREGVFDSNNREWWSYSGIASTDGMYFAMSSDNGIVAYRHGNNNNTSKVYMNIIGGLTANTTYDYSFDVSADGGNVTDLQHQFNGSGGGGTWGPRKSVTAGNTETVTGTITPTAASMTCDFLFLGASIGQGTAIKISNITFTPQSSGPTDPMITTVTRDSATAGTINWTNSGSMPSGQIYYIYDGNTKIGETTAQSNTSYQVTGLADFNSHTYTVKGYYDGDTSTGVTATIPEYDPWIKMTANQTMSLDDGNSVYNADPGANGMAYYYNSTTSWKTIKLKQLRSPRAVADAGWQRINVRGDRFYTNLTDGHKYIVKLKYKASEASGSVVMDLPGIYGYDHTIDNSGNTWNYIESGEITYDSSNTNVYGTGATVQIKVGAAGTGVVLSDFDVEFEDVTPSPVAPASVTATRSTSVWNGIDISFAAGTNPPQGQTYSIKVGGTVIESNALPGVTYSTTIPYDTATTVEVVASFLGNVDSTSTSITIPEYKNIREFNGDAMVAAQNLGETYGDQSNLVYKVDASGVHIKNTNASASAGMNLLNKGTVLSTNVPYYTTFTYTSNVADTQTVTYGVNTDYFYSRGTISQTTAASSGNVISFVATPGDKTGANCYAGIGWSIPANGEFTITATTCAAAASAVDVASVSGSSSTPNTVVASWVEGSNPPAYQNYVVDLLDSSDAVVDTATVAAGTTTCTFENVAKGTGYKIRVKAKVDETYASAAGVSSTTFEVHDAAPVAPTSVVATRSTSVWNGVNVSFAAGSNPPAGQTYSIEVDGVEIENNATPGTTYSTTVSYGTGITVEVIAHSDGTTASTSTTVDVPEYKPIDQLNIDSINTDYGEYYADYARLVYKIDLNGDLHIKNTDSEVNAGINFLYKKYQLTTNTAYLATMEYTSDTAFTQVNANYGVDSVTEGRCVSQGQTNIETTASSGNEVTFMVTPTAAQIAAGDANAYVNLVIPAGGEFTITDFTLSTNNPPEDLDSVGATSTTSTPNQINVTLTKPSPSSAPVNQVYEIYLDNTLVDAVAVSTTTYTIDNVAKGTHTVTVKARVASTYASAAGVTSSSVTVHDPQPVAPASVTASETSNHAYSIDVSFAAGSNPPAGQTYSIAFVDSGSHEYEVKAAGTAVPGTTYHISEMNGAPIPVGTYTVKVYAHNDGTTAVTTTTATVEWNRAANTWDTTKIGDWEFLGSYTGVDPNWGELGYKGTTFDNMQVKAINPSGPYSIQMRIANEDLYAGLVDGKVYNFSLKFKSSAAGTVKWTQNYYQSEQTLAVTNYDVSHAVNEMQSTFKYDKTACEAGETPYFYIELSNLPQGAVLYDFDLDIDILDWQPLAANETIQSGTGTTLYSDGNANTMAYYNGSNTSWSNVRVKRIAAPTTSEWAYVNSMNITNASLYKINGTSMEVGHKYRMTMTYSAPGTTGGTLYVQQDGCSHFTGDNYDAVDSSTGQIQRDFVYDNASEGFRIFYGALANGVEITNIQFTFTEIPREVVGLNATSNSGDKLTAAWADPVSGLSQTYIVSLYDSTGTTPISGKTDIPVSAKNYTFTGLDANTTYTVKVVSTLGAGNNSAAVSTTGTTSEWIQMTDYSTVNTTDGKTTVKAQYGNLAYYYNSLGSLNTLQLKRTNPAQAQQADWWFYQVVQTNANAYSTLTNGHLYRMTVSYNTNADASGSILLRQIFGENNDTVHEVVPNKTGANKDSFTVDFTYNSSYDANETQLWLAGLGNGTIISNIEYSFVELESWETATKDEWVEVGDYAYLAKSEEHDSPTLAAQYSTSAGYPLSLKGNLGGWEGGGRYRVGTSKVNAKPNSAYNYSITFNRSDNYTGSTATLLVDFGNGKNPTTLGTMTLSDAGSANAAFTGKVVVPNDAKYMRIYGQFTWERANEKFSVVSYNLTPISEFSLTNDGTNVVADWSELNIAPAKLTYTSEGVDYEVTSFVDSTYTFSAHYPDNGSEVLLLDNNDEILARVVAFADLTITKVFINRPEGQETDGVIHANTNNTVNVFVKNIGVARANSNTVQDIYVKVSHDDWYNHAFDKDTILLPNQDVEEKVYGLRYSEPGTYSIECTVNDGYVILESSVDNNSTTKQFEIDTQIEDDTAVLGFQINTNKAEGSPSEFNPSYRTVCRASKRVYPVGGPAEGYAVTNYGFIYALTEQADLDDPFNQMRLSEDGGEAGTNEYIKSYQAQSTLDLDEWTTKDGSTYNNDNSYFYALTIYDKYYTTDQYETNYTYRSYLQYRDNNNVLHTVYPKDIYSASLYEIAEDLYKYEKMPTKGSHDFLYDNILNIVSMKHNHQAIAMDMMTKLHSAGKMPSASSPNYRYCNMINKDLTYYALCSDPKGHTPAEDPQYAYMIYRYSKAKAETGYENYTHDDQFTSIQLSEAGGTSAFVNDLNYCTDSDYETVFDWIYNEIDHDKGFYKKVAYEWDTNLDKDYGTE